MKLTCIVNCVVKNEMTAPFVMEFLASWSACVPSSLLFFLIAVTERSYHVLCPQEDIPQQWRMRYCKPSREDSGRNVHLIGWNGLQRMALALQQKILWHFREKLVSSNCFTPVRSPESNGMAEAFVKPLKRDYAVCHELPSAKEVMKLMVVWIEDYN